MTFGMKSYNFTIKAAFLMFFKADRRSNIPDMKRILALLIFVSLRSLAESEPPDSPAFRSSYLSAGFSRSTPAFSWFAVDSLGGGENLENVVLAEKLPGGNDALKTNGAPQFDYVRRLANGSDVKLWRVTLSDKKIVLQSEFVEGTEPEPF